VSDSTARGDAATIDVSETIIYLLSALKYRNGRHVYLHAYVLVGSQVTFDLKPAYVALEFRRASSGGSDLASHMRCRKHLAKKKSMPLLFFLLLFPLDLACLGWSALHFHL